MGLLKKDRDHQESIANAELKTAIAEMRTEIMELKMTNHVQAAYIDVSVLDSSQCHNGVPKRLHAEQGCGPCRGDTGVGPRPQSRRVQKHERRRKLDS